MVGGKETDPWPVGCPGLRSSDSEMERLKGEHVFS